jgi:hypothetical protein
LVERRPKVRNEVLKTRICIRRDGQFVKVRHLLNDAFGVLDAIELRRDSLSRQGKMVRS